MDSATGHSANVLGAVVDVLARELEAAGSAAAPGGGARAAALTALAGYASGEPIDRLAAGLGLSHSRTVRIVDALEDDGLVARARAEADRRAVTVTLTPAGRERAAAVLAARRAVLAAEVAALEPADRAALDRIAATLLARRVDGRAAARRTCRLCDPDACGHPDRCPVTRAADAATETPGTVPPVSPAGASRDDAS
jgi:DNA-binding MarR family transcriptional regulator